MDNQVQPQNYHREGLRLQSWPNCQTLMGDMPGSRNAYCPSCGFKDPCCE